MLRIGKNYTIFQKVLFVFVSIVLIVYMLFVQIIQLGRQDMNMNNIEFERSKAEFVFNTFQSDLLNIRDQLSFMLNDTKFVRLISNVKHPIVYEYISTVNGIREGISKIVYSSSLVSDVILYAPTLHKKISSNWIEDIDMEEYKSILRRITDKEDELILMDDSIYITMRTAFQSYMDKDMEIPYALILAKIPRQKILSHFNRFFHHEKIRYSIINTKDYQVFTSNFPGEEETQQQIIGRIQGYNGLLPLSFIDVLNEQEGVYYVSASPKIKIGFCMLIQREYFHSAQKKYINIILLVSCAILVVILSFFAFVRGIIQEPFDKMVQVFKKVEEGDLDLNMDYKRNDEFRFLYKAFNKMLQRIRELIREVYEQRIRMQEAELKQLQYQINPHFLYNSLLVLYNMIKFQDSDNAMKMARHLSNYYKYIIKNNIDMTPLESEIEHVKNYVVIQNLRFANRILVEIDEIPEEYRTMMVPRLIIQPIIENSYKYGLKNIDGTGIIELRFDKDERFLRIFIEDNGGEVGPEEIASISSDLIQNNLTNKGTGLVNVHRRLQIKYGEESGLFVSIGKLKGLCVELRIERSKMSYV